MCIEELAKFPLQTLQPSEFFSCKAVFGACGRESKKVSRIETCAKQRIINFLLAESSCFFVLILKENKRKNDKAT